MKKMVVFECSKAGTEKIYWVKKEVKNFNITKIEVPDNAVAFWFEKVKKELNVMHGKRILIGKVFSRAELKKMALINEEYARVARLVDYNDAYGAILRKDGSWKCWQKGEKVLDL